MTDTIPPSRSAPLPRQPEEISVLALGAAIVKRWRLVLAFAVLGGIGGAIYSYAQPQLYEAKAIFVPQGADQSTLSAAASQFGFRIPTSGSAWGPSMYVELVRTRDMLLPIVWDTLQLPEQGNRRVALVDLLRTKGPSPQRTAGGTIGKLGLMISASEARKLNAVQVTVKSKWATVSYWLTRRLIDRLNQFNIETRRSQATVERQFVQAQAQEAAANLRDAEDRQRAFLRSNRAIDNSPDLRAEYERTQREVNRLSQLYLSWMQALDQARTSEVRNTPVITMLEEPQMPMDPMPRGTLRIAILMAIAGGLAGLMLAILIEGMLAIRRSDNQEVRDFMLVARQSLPAFVQRRPS